MTRTLLATCLFTAAAFALLSSPADGQPPAAKSKKQPAGKYDPPKAARPDAATLKQIADKTEQLRRAVAELKANKLPDDVLIEGEIYLKAAENIVRFEEWYAKDSGKWALTTLDRGLERAKQAAGGKAPWRDAAGKWVVRAYRSLIDDSIQPYAVLLPHDYGKDPKKQWRLDVVLHGRDSSLTEAKFIATHDSSKTAPKDLGYIQLEPYGRGNNAFRWAGETDVLEAEADASWKVVNDRREKGPVDENRTVLRGFSMGGAGTWHIGLHHPSRYCVIGPGAGFSATHGYIKGLPNPLPDFQEKCLRIYDAVDYAENAFNVPVVAYSGEKDAQKAAADNIEQALKGFKESLRFTHLIAPGLEHQQPKEWQDKAEVEYRKYADQGRDPNPKRVRYVTFTPRYGRCDWLQIIALEKMYARAVVDGTRIGNTVTLTTANIRELTLLGFEPKKAAVVINGQKLTVPNDHEGSVITLNKRGGHWVIEKSFSGRDHRLAKKPEKNANWPGPIDDAFTHPFVVVRPEGPGWHSAVTRHAAAEVGRFSYTWDKYFRGALRVKQSARCDLEDPDHFVLFGDPESNPLVAKVLPHLPITWTKDKLVVNGVAYDPKTHIPVMIYPNPFSLSRTYVVLNSGHTFKEADLKGTNALLYPRLGDWAVIKPTPTAKDPAAYEVVAAGLFDENWRFPKKPATK